MALPTGKRPQMYREPCVAQQASRALERAKTEFCMFGWQLEFVSKREAKPVELTVRNSLRHNCMPAYY